MNILLVLFFFQVKHLLIDFFLQTRYMAENKHKLGHMGGVIHACLHGIGTFWIVFCFLPLSSLAYFLLFFDVLCHYWIDWSKMNIVKNYGWNVKTEEFWWTLGVDQFLHQMTYILFIALMLRG